MATFHEGEIAVQERAGVRWMAQRVGQSIHSEMPYAAQEFLRAQPFVVLGGADNQGAVWATLLRGAPGFAHALDEHNLRVEALPLVGDPLREVWNDSAPVGMLAIEPMTRRRMRVNGTGQIEDGSLLIQMNQVYSNCPKYIQKRQLESGSVPVTASTSVERATVLSAGQQRFIEGADTFFIASLAPEGGADASHRGGTAGFVRVESEKHIAFPDYSGNAMFNTLGNLQSNPRAGLLFVDWESGAILQLSGTAQVNWDAQRAVGFADAERVVEFEVEQVVAREGGLGWHWDWVEASPFNPTPP